MPYSAAEFGANWLKGILRTGKEDPKAGSNFTSQRAVSTPSQNDLQPVSKKISLGVSSHDEVHADALLRFVRANDRNSTRRSSCKDIATPARNHVRAIRTRK